MAINIVWSPRALDNFHDVIAYLERNWNSQVIKDFCKKDREGNSSNFTPSTNVPANF